MTEDSIVGRQIGNYVITRLLGRGGFGAVYLAAHPQIEREVAVKILDKEVMAFAGERFVDEARAASRIKHPNIIEIFDLGQTDDGLFYYVMEYLPGKDLCELMTEVIDRDGRMEPRQLKPYVEQICAGLQAAHGQGVVHRDLKPENVFVLPGESPTLKILDFGIAKLMDREDTGVATTKTGQVMGTPLFIAPEQAAGKVREISIRTDIYSLGVILYWMLCGSPPIMAEQSLEIMYLQIHETPKDLGERVPSLPPGVVALVMQCLEKQPAARPASAQEVSDRFAAALSGAEAPASDRTATKPGRPDLQPKNETLRHDEPAWTRGATMTPAQVKEAMGETVGAGEPAEPAPPAVTGSTSPPVSNTTLGSTAGEIQLLQPRPKAMGRGLKLALGGVAAVLMVGLGVLFGPWGESQEEGRDANAANAANPVPRPPDIGYLSEPDAGGAGARLDSSATESKGAATRPPAAKRTTPGILRRPHVRAAPTPRARPDAAAPKAPPQPATSPNTSEDDDLPL